MPDEIYDAIFFALIHHEEYLLNEACEDNMSNATMLEYLEDIKACKKAKQWIIENST